ncbi:hypothetical protein ED733_000683 [Metarhizium rileyi]|uniref:FAD-dependent oxidoreductase 2 FAD-binding domain-containing protein n=1 Tax=Metarhizium rileyi (strain RCEF 4871) TaxID=1649241 RepID=A0A5C6G2B6_METRR|nr:hypothetical protein ED733_000683 [Metarhizium rileyi]
MNRITSWFSSTSPRQSFDQTTFDTEVDVLIIGGGAAGLTASLRAHSRGLKPLIVEKSDQFGGSSAYSGGSLWIPRNRLAREAGIRDSKENALKYMETLIGDVGPASTRQRRVAYLDQGPFMVDFLTNLGFNWEIAKGMLDYHPKVPGALPRFGRTIEAGSFDLNRLKEWQTLLRMRPKPQPPISTDEYRSLTAMGSSAKEFVKGVRIICRVMWLRAAGEARVTFGQSLVGQLLHLNQQSGLSLWRSTSLVDIIQQSDGTVTGARVQRDNQIRSIRARRGVLLCAGGFAHNQAMRDQYGQAPASIEWTNTPKGDTGDAIRAGMKLGAATALMDDAWWGPTSIDPVAGENFFAMQERSRPFSIIVDSTGSRFMNESASYFTCGQNQYARNRKVKAIPAWLVLDANHRKRYALGSLLPRQKPKTGVEAGHLYTANTVTELASQIGVDPSNLQATVSRFNAMAEAGVDRDFGRGSDEFDNYFGDPKVTPNPNLGPISAAPYYAVPVFPGDLGTKGGLVTDEHARVLKEDGSVIEGLYATGNTSASVMGRTYPGAGATLGPALTFAYIAVNHMAGGSRQ